MRERVVVLASGNGSNAVNLYHRLAHNPERWQFCGLLTDRPTAPVVERFKMLGEPVVFLNYARSRQQGESDLLAYIEREKIDWIFLAGFMRVLSPAVIKTLWNKGCERSRIVNIHPSLLPLYPGLNSYQRALENGDKVIGATVHFVDAGVDTGPIISQRALKRQAGENSQDFLRRALESEHELYSHVIGLIEQKVLDNGRLLPLSSSQSYLRSNPLSNSLKLQPEAHS